MKGNLLTGWENFIVDHGGLHHGRADTDDKYENYIMVEQIQMTNMRIT